MKLYMFRSTVTNSLNEEDEFERTCHYFYETTGKVFYLSSHKNFEARTILDKAVFDLFFSAGKNYSYAPEAYDKINLLPWSAMVKGSEPVITRTKELKIARSLMRPMSTPKNSRKFISWLQCDVQDDFISSLTCSKIPGNRVIVRTSISRFLDVGLMFLFNRFLIPMRII